MLGAENGARTRDLNLGKVALYQLSYFRVSGMQRYDIFFAFASFSALFCIPFLIFFYPAPPTPPRSTIATTPSDASTTTRSPFSHLPIPYDGPAVLDINFDYAVAGDLAFEDGA